MTADLFTRDGGNFGKELHNLALYLDELDNIYWEDWGQLRLIFCDFDAPRLRYLC